MIKHRYVKMRVALILTVLAMAALILQACSTPTRQGPVPQQLTSKATVLGIPNARYFPDEQGDLLAAEGLASFQREVATKNLQLTQLPPAHFLAISGGGDDGAFGAGLLVGWSESGTRPEFKLVTGISTGSLLAPFAFLGSSYDSQLKELYTTISAENIFEERGLLAAINDDALTDTSPLFALISKNVDEAMMADIAAAYDEGRLLIIGSTDLDAQRPVLWNVGAIAKSGHPSALNLIHKILRASAAVPAVFPPVMIDVEADGQTYQEMHVDGGAIAQLFLYPPAVGRTMREEQKERHITRERYAYVIRNGRLGANWTKVERATMDIAGRAISTMIHYSGINDLFKVYTSSVRDGVDFNLAFIEDDFQADHPADFDTGYMNVLFEYGYEKGRAGYPWHKFPPFIESPLDVSRAPAK